MCLQSMEVLLHSSRTIHLHFHLLSSSALLCTEKLSSLENQRRNTPKPQTQEVWILALPLLQVRQKTPTSTHRYCTLPQIKLP